MKTGQTGFGWQSGVALIVMYCYCTVRVERDDDEGALIRAFRGSVAENLVDIAHRG